MTATEKDPSVLLTLEQQRRGARANRTGARAAGYQDEWYRTLERRGVTPNGSYEQQRAGSALVNFKPRSLAKPTTLAQVARAFDMALAAGRIRYAPSEELDAHVARIGFNYVEQAKARLPKTALAKATRRRWY